MSFYDELLRASENLSDILFPRFAIVTSVVQQRKLVNVREKESGLVHANVPVLNGLEITKGDTVIILFVDNDLHKPIIIGKV